MANRNFLLQVIANIKKQEAGNDWRGTITKWTKC